MLVEGLVYCLQPGVINFSNALAEAYIEAINTNLSRAAIQRDALKKNENLYRANTQLIEMVKTLDARLVESQKTIAERDESIERRDKTINQDSLRSTIDRARIDALTQLMYVTAEAERKATEEDEITGLDELSSTHYYLVKDYEDGKYYRAPMTKREYLFISFTLRNIIFCDCHGKENKGLEEFYLKLLVEKNLELGLNVADIGTFLERKPVFDNGSEKRRLRTHGVPVFLANGKHCDERTSVPKVRFGHTDYA